MVSVCLPSDALSQHLPSYLGFSYLGCGVSLHGCSSKEQLLLLTLDEEYLLMATPPDLELGVAPLSPSMPALLPILGSGLLLSATAPDLGRGVAPLGCGYVNHQVKFLRPDLHYKQVLIRLYLVKMMVNLERDVSMNVKSQFVNAGLYLLRLISWIVLCS